MRRGAQMLPRLGMLAAALSLAMVVAVTVTTPLHSEPGDHISVEEASFSEPIRVERPIAIAKGFQKLPDIRPEPAVSPEIRKQKLERQEERQEARRREAEQRELERQRAERQRAERQRAERQRVERRRVERQRAEIQRAKAEREKAAASFATRRVRQLPAGVSGRAQAGQSKPGARRPAPRGSKMALTIREIGLRNSKIETTDEQRALDRGLIHLPQTSRPWERGKARNVYVVGHRMGWPGTKSWKIFYRLDELQRNDRLVLTAAGKTYRYKVTEKLVVTPWDLWVMDPVKGRDLLTLQTCTGPDFSQRLIVRADRV